jgi:ribosomal protein S21
MTDILCSLLGRTVTSGDFGRAIRRLHQILQRNKVKQEWRRDKYYTKPFQLRYQLRSRRHRQRFAAKVSILHFLRSQYFLYVQKELVLTRFPFSRFDEWCKSSKPSNEGACDQRIIGLL